MIASIAGTITTKGDRFLIVETGGIGYRVAVTPALIASVKTGAAVTLYTHHHIAENVQELYGFLSVHDVAFFEQLLSISSVGPKTALNVMGIATIDEIKSAIQHGDPTLLTKVSGVGRKTAERIVLELKEKVDLAIDAQSTEAMRDDAAVLDALVSLGYSRNEARQAVRALPKTLTGVSDRVREALKHTGSRHHEN